MSKVLLLHIDSLSHPGGAEKVLCNLANALVERGWNVGVLAWDPKATRLPYPTNDGVALYNAALGAPDCLRNSHLLDKLVGCFALEKYRRHELRRLYSLRWKAGYMSKFFKEFSPDVVVAFSPEANYLCSTYLNIEVPIVVMVHEGPNKCFVRKHFSKMRCSLERADAIQVLLPRYVEDLKEFFKPRNVFVIPNVAPQYDRVSELRSNTIISVGRLYPSKRQDLLIEAFAEVVKTRPEWRLIFWGGASAEDAYVEHLKDLVRQHKLNDCVHFAGITENVEEQLLQASIFGFPSANEGFSLAVTEAMSAGLPIVACSDCESIVAMLDGTGAAEIVEPTISALSKTLADLMDSPKKRIELGSRGKEISKKYSPKVIWDLWSRKLSDLSERRKENISDI